MSDFTVDFTVATNRCWYIFDNWLLTVYKDDADEYDAGLVLLWF